MATKLEDLRKVKDQATKAIEKRQYEKAAELYLEIGRREPDPDWHQRAGEAYRRAGKNEPAVTSLSAAADGYARGGFLLKAIAVSKSILQVDPQHTATQAMLASLYATRDGATASTSRPEQHATPEHLRPPTAAPATPASAPPIVEPASIGAPPSIPTPASAPPSIAFHNLLEAPSNAPMGSLPLREVLSHRRSEQFAVADIAALASEMPAAYEIALDDEDLDVEMQIVAPTAPVPTAPAGDELDFGGLMDEPVASPPLPQIPLFSSLAESELRFLIDRMTLRELEQGETIVRQGDRGGSLFVVVDGRVRVVTMTSAGARELASLGAGAFFGEMGVLTDDPRSATVEASAPTRLLEISRELTWEIARRSPEVLRIIMRFFRDRMLDRLLSSTPLFAGLNPDEARELASQFIFLELDAGMVAVQQGTRAPGLFFLLCGEAEAVRDGARLGLLGAGDVFGEMSLLLRIPASADVRILKKCWALELPRDRFQEIMVTYPQVLAYVSELGEERRAKLDGRVDLV